MPDPVITLVTPTRNQADTIGQTLQSVLDQNLGAALEYVVRDACSDDGTEALAHSFEASFRTQGVLWSYIRERDDGQADAINKGWRAARGEVLGYLNSDDYLLPGALETVACFFAENQDAQWGCGGWQLVSASGRVHRTLPPRRFRRGELLNHSILGQPSCFFRKRLLRETGELNPRLHLAMDYDLWLRIAERHPLDVIPGVLSAMRYHAGAKSATQTIRQLDEILHLAMRYTHPLSLRRLLQYFYYLRGRAVTAAGWDISRRVARADGDGHPGTDARPGHDHHGLKV